MLLYHPTARVLLHKGNTSAARDVMRKIYAYAKPEDIDLKVPPSFLSQSLSNIYPTHHLSPFDLLRSGSSTQPSNNPSI